MEVDQTKISKNKASVTPMSKDSESETDFVSYSLESNDEGFTRIQNQKARKSWLHATYGRGFVWRLDKKPKASTSTSTVAPYRRPPSHRQIKPLLPRVPSIWTGRQTPRTLLRHKKLRPPRLQNHRSLRPLTKRRQWPPWSRSTRMMSSRLPPLKNSNDLHPYFFMIRDARATERTPNRAG
ncbi:hypothetical protein EVAR_19482_1 [Eumeta japonica]|uniref:Uncharacterized protein n=1 Tax=Eumeta variegata TaxID=151549 RepID=A0A4C1V8S3_EUMVA|nr:hypothetical protein EVAR_19482_1 [Eumeta japonica]